MGAVLPVFRLARGHRQETRNELKIRLAKNDPMEQKEMFAASLSIPAELHPIKRKVGNPFNCHRRRSVQRGDRHAKRFHDHAVGRRDGLEFLMAVEWKDERVIQAAGHLNDSSASRTPPEDRDPESATIIDSYFATDGVCVANDDKTIARFPETERSVSSTLFAFKKKRLITRKVLPGRRKCKIEKTKRIVHQ